METLAEIILCVLLFILIVSGRPPKKQTTEIRFPNKIKVEYSKVKKKKKKKLKPFSKTTSFRKPVVFDNKEDKIFD